MTAPPTIELPPQPDAEEDLPQPPKDVAPGVDDVAPPGEEELEDDDEVVDEPPVVDAQEELEPKVLPVERTLSDSKGRSISYTQQPLRYFGKIQLYGLLGRAIQVLMEGENGLGFDDVMDLADPRSLVDKMMGALPGADTAPDADEKSESMGIEEAAKMMGAFAKVVSAAPNLLLEAYCIILTPQQGHWKWLTEWGLPNMDDEMGTDILHTFVDQNWGVMEDFFAREMPKIFRRAAKARQRHKSAGGQSRR